MSPSSDRISAFQVYRLAWGRSEIHNADTINILRTEMQRAALGSLEPIVKAENDWLERQWAAGRKPSSTLRIQMAARLLQKVTVSATAVGSALFSPIETPPWLMPPPGLDLRPLPPGVLVSPATVSLTSQGAQVMADMADEGLDRTTAYFGPFSDHALSVLVGTLVIGTVEVTDPAYAQSLSSDSLSAGQRWSATLAFRDGDHLDPAINR